MLPDSLSTLAEQYPGSDFDAAAYVDFAQDHDPDPLNWPSREREQYAEFAASHTGGAR